MPRFFRAPTGLLLVLSAFLVLSHCCSAQTVWSGLSFTFTKANGTDPTLPENQDRISDDVWITRSQIGMGLFNAASECNIILGCTFTHNFSPADTRWATAAMLANSSETIAAANWQNLAFTDWEAAYRNQVGQNILNPSYRDAVVHLIADDIYLDLRFTGWTAQGGGGFSYQRAVPSSTPPPTGDYNLNGVVDAADYIVWRDTLTQSAAPEGSGADGNANGTIESGDYTFWRQRFGNPVPGSAAGGNLQSSTAVPEPMAIFLSFAWLLAFVQRTKRIHT